MACVLNCDELMYMYISCLHCMGFSKEIHGSCYKGHSSKSKHGVLYSGLPARRQTGIL